MNTDLREMAFKDFVTLQRGFDLPRSRRVPGRYPVVASTSATGTHDEYKVEPPGVVTGRSGSLGDVQYITKPFWPLNTTLWVKDFKGHSPKYVYYHLQTLDLGRFDSGASVPTLNRNDLDSLRIAVPGPDGQREIAAILSAYDDLIENNTRRIAILEEIAQMFYREWFVHFRFPGYEDVEMVDSELGAIPEGWNVQRVKEIVKRLRPGKRYKQKELADAGEVPVVSQSEERVRGWHDNASDHEATPREPIILFGDHTCKMVLMIRPFSIAENVVPFVSKNDTPVIYLYHLTADLVESREYRRHWTPFKNKIVVCAPTRCASRFTAIVRPFYEYRDVLLHRNRMLRQARDLLLPRLVSGELDVADLPIEGGPLAA